MSHPRRSTRRSFLRRAFGWLAYMIMAGIVGAFYAFWGEQKLLRVKRHSITSRKWTAPPLKIAIISDIHMGEPFVGLGRLERIVARINDQGADIIFILGDLVAGHHFLTKQVKVADTAQKLGALTAPLGVFAVNGNHDWWDDLTAQRDKKGPVLAHKALEANGIPVLSNESRKIAHGDGFFWLGGLEDQLALSLGGGRFEGLHDLDKTLAQMGDGSKILLAHEPDIFTDVPDDVALTLSGHTHGGQVRLFGWSPIVPSRYGNRFAYGNVHENGRDLVVSGGIGCSIAPIRFGVMPEITMVELKAG